jgi:hypothetical protein
VGYLSVHRGEVDRVFSTQIEVYPFNGHDGGGTQHFLAKLAFLATLPHPS